MATIADLLVKIGADTSDLRKELNATKRQIKTAFGSEALDVSKKSLAVLGGIGAYLAALGVASVKAGPVSRVPRLPSPICWGARKKHKTSWGRCRTLQQRRL